MARNKRDSVVVLLPEGGQGELEGGSAALSAARRIGSHVTVVTREGERLVVPAASLHPEAEGLCRLLPVSRGVEAAGPHVNDAGEAVTIVPVIEEQLQVSKQKRVTGRVRLTKTVREEEAVVDEALFSERVELERVPVNRPVSGIPATRQEGDVLVVPVMEEVLVVEKRLLLKEEIRIRRVREERHEPQKVTLRKEEVHVERRDASEVHSD